MLSAIDHLIIAVAEPDAAAAEIEAVLGLSATGGGRHEAHGTFNRLIWLADSYIELMGVFDRSLAAESWWGAHMSGLLDGASATYAGLALASDDLDSDIERLRGQGAPISDPVAGERARPDGEVVRWRIGRPPAPDPDLGLVFLIEHDTSSAEWRPADREARAGQVHPLGTSGRLARFVVPVPDAGATTFRLLRQLGMQFRPSLVGHGARDTSIGGQLLRVTPSAAGQPPTIAIRAGRQPQQADLLGCRWVIDPV
ncbi:MAG TPA: VOC family protein [Candidatus Limnocylindrales bacterium]|nr:VOC family protein [Candidatus Limnocylindrales bacterium]